MLSNRTRFDSYEDLKPPSSPSPTASGPKETLTSTAAAGEEASSLTGGNDVATTLAVSVVEEETSQNSTWYHSPYHV